MSDKKFTLEEILDEYSPDKSKVKHSKKPQPDMPKGKMETEEMLDNAGGKKTPERKIAPAAASGYRKYSEGAFEPGHRTDKRVTVKDAVSGNEVKPRKSPEEIEEKSEELRKDTDELLEEIKEKTQKEKKAEKKLKPTQNPEPTNLLRSRVSFVRSPGADEKTTPDRSNDDIDGYDGAKVVSEGIDNHVPLIRKMENSTRSRELDKAKKKKKGKRVKLQKSYKKETPEGIYAGSKKQKKDDEMFVVKRNGIPVADNHADEEPVKTLDDYQKSIKQTISSVKNEPPKKLSHHEKVKIKKEKQKGKEPSLSDTKHIPIISESDVLEAVGEKKYDKKSEEKHFTVPIIKPEDIENLDIPIEPEKKEEDKKSKKKTERKKEKEKKQLERQRARVKKREKAQRKREKKYAEPEPQRQNRDEIAGDLDALASYMITRILVLVVCDVFSILLSTINHFSNASILRTDIGFTVMCLVQAVFGIIAIVAAWSTVKNGIMRLFLMQSDSDTMAAIGIVFSVVSTIVAAFTPELIARGEAHIFIPCAISVLLVNTYGKLTIVRRAVRNIRFISNKPWKAMVAVDNEENAASLTRGLVTKYPVLLSFRKTAYLTDFIRYTYSSDNADKYCKVSSPIYTLLSLAVAAGLAYLRSGNMTGIETASFGLGIFTTLILLTATMGVTLAVNMPLEDASKEFSKRDGAILGYQSIDDFYDANSVLVTAKQLFPVGSVHLDKVKILSDIQIEENLIAAASLANYAESLSATVLVEKLAGSEEKLYDVSSFQYEDGNGLSGWINNKRVLLGSRRMMETHSIEGLLPEVKENEYAGESGQVIYLAVSGNLSALFVISLSGDRKVRDMLKALSAENVKVCVRSVDFFVTDEVLRKTYGLDDNSIKVIPQKLHGIYEEETKKVRMVSSSVLSGEHLSGITRLITGIKKLRVTTIMGVSIQIVSAACGFIIGLIFIFMGAFSSLTASFVLIFQIICTIITVIAARIRDKKLKL